MDLKLPALGEGADSGTVVNLFVKEGDQITKDQPILELENEKAVATIPSTAAGTVSKMFVKSGDKISVGQKLLSLTENAGAEQQKAAKPGAAPKAETAESGKKAEGAEQEETPAEKEEPEPETDSPSAESKPGATPATSPSIRKLARELGIDLNRVRWSEAGGRIVMADLRAYIQKLQAGVAGKQPAGTKTGQPQPSKPAIEQIDFSKWGPVSKKPLSPLRQTIARRMAESWNTVPHVTQFDEADITRLMELRKEHAPTYEQKGTHLTLTS